MLKLDHAAMAEAAALRARTYLQLALPADRVHFIDSEAGLDRHVHDILNLGHAHQSWVQHQGQTFRAGLVRLSFGVHAHSTGPNEL